jgi:hypothetical protein
VVGGGEIDGGSGDSVNEARAAGAGAVKADGDLAAPKAVKVERGEVDLGHDAAGKPNIAAVKGVVGLSPGGPSTEAHEGAVAGQRGVVKMGEVDGDAAVYAVGALVGVMAAAADGELALIRNDNPHGLESVLGRLGHDDAARVQHGGADQRVLMSWSYCTSPGPTKASGTAF